MEDVARLVGTLGIIVGIDAYNRKVFLDTSTDNNHMGVWGGTGTGKTTWIETVLLQLANYFTQMHILRFAWHGCTQRNQRVPIISEELDRNTFTVFPDEDLPLKLFDSVRRDSLNRNNQEIEIGRITEILASAAKLPPTQRTATLASVKETYITGAYERYGLKTVGDNLLDLGAAGRHAYTKLYSVFEGANIRYGEIEFNKPVCELDIDKFDDVAQRVIVNLVTSYYYDRAKRDRYINDGLALVIDEAQNADLRRGQIISQMLMESRKKNVRMILATPQPFAHSREFEAIQQCGTKIFFKPAGYERKLAKIIDPRHEEEMVLVLKHLNRGEFVAVGRFVTEDRIKINQPIKLRTFIPDIKREARSMNNDMKCEKNNINQKGRTGNAKGED